MKKALTVGIAAAAMMAMPAAAALADAHTDAQLVVVHGVPDLEVDIFVDGEAFLEGVNFEDTAVDTVPAGSYELAIAPAGEGVDAAVLQASAEVEGGASYSIVAHLTENGDPTVLLAGNETGDGAGIQVFHTAAFGAVDILPTDATGLEGVTNGQTAFVATGAGDVEGVGIAAAGDAEAAIDLGTVTVPDDTVVLAYAVGDAETLTVVTEAIDVAAAEAEAETERDDEADEMEQPSEVAAGSGGLVDSGLPVWVSGLMALGALAVVAPAVVAAGRRS